jgi:hypothetical protein
VKARYVTIYLVVLLASLSWAVDSSGAESGSSQPPDTHKYSRPSIPEDLAVARRKPLAVPPQAAGPSFKLERLIDVINNDGGLTSGEPSIAVNPENPNMIVVHEGFRDWDPGGPKCASLRVSTNGGATWKLVASLDRPTNIPLANGPDDVTLAYGANSLLTGSFLVGVNPFHDTDNAFLFTGNTTDPTKISSFEWRTIFGGGPHSAKQLRRPLNCSLSMRVLIRE